MEKSKNGKKKIMLYAATNYDKKGNMELANFVMALCQLSINDEIYSIDRHDLINVDNIRNSAYNSIILYDILVFLIDEYPSIEATKTFNPNVWFELGLASSQLNKQIIIISLYKDTPPFYTSDIKPVVINSNLFEYLKEHLDEFENSKINEIDMIARIRNKLLSELSEDNQQRNQPLVYALTSFKDEFILKLDTSGNPYIRQHELSQFQNKMYELGHGEIYDLLKNMVKNTQAEFIDGEKAAFKKLIEEVSKAEESLLTTRFANQSIVFSSSDNAVLHNKFMQQLYGKSNLQCFERIICNNHYSKWNDIVKIMLNGKNIKLFIRKCEYSIGFEMVIIDSKTTFIHFYQLSHDGNQNPDGTDYAADNQVINSTLMLSGNEVNVRMKKVFQRLHHREQNDPSRTLLGVPKSDELSDEQKEHGFFELNYSSPDENKIGNIYRLLINSFKSWYNDMKTENSEIGMRDCVNMGVGIAVATDVESSKEIANFIYEHHKDDLKYFTTFIEKEMEDISKKKKEIKTEISERKRSSFENMEKSEHLLDAFLNHLKHVNIAE